MLRSGFHFRTEPTSPYLPFSMSVLSDPEIRLEPGDLPEIPLPKGWSELTLHAVLHVISLARIALLNAYIWPDGPECDGLRLRAENDRLKSEIALLQLEIQIKDARFARLEPKRRPHYLPHERLEILVIQATRGWSNVQIAKRFQVTLQTIRNWIQGKDREETIVQIAEKPTRYPNFVRYIVQQI